MDFQEGATNLKSNVRWAVEFESKPMRENVAINIMQST